MGANAMIEALTKALANEATVAAAYLFGSLARGQARSDSDIDLGVLFN